MRGLQAAGGTTLGPRGVIGARASRIIIAVVAVVGVAIDQTTKWAAATYLDPANPPRYLGGLITLQLARNPGAAFSLGGDKITIVFSLLAVAALVACLVWFVPRVKVRSWAVVCGLVLAGITGNFIDRLVRPPGVMVGHVVDFIQFPYFAIFNVADMCLTCSAAAVILLMTAGSTDLDGTTRRKAAAQGQAAS